MRRALFATDRCRLFRNIASDVWSRIIYAHNAGMDLPEIGITAEIIVDILQFAKNRIPNFDVFARPSWDENTYGSDIDVFVETLPGQFRWFALQAKVLKKNNRYDTLRDSSDGIMQWDKLALLEGASGCKAYYLLYNGKERFHYTGFDLCRNPFSDEEFGCSLVETHVIRALANRTSPTGRFIRPTFEDIHPANAQPWRILTCCRHDTKNYILYTRDEILASNPVLSKIEYDKIDTDVEDDEMLTENQQKEAIDIPIVENNGIYSAARNANWNPHLRIIINRTDNLKKQ